MYSLGFIDGVVQELSGSVGADITRLERQPLAFYQKANPYAKIFYYAVDQLTPKGDLLAGPELHREYTFSDFPSLISTKTVIEGVRSYLPWALDRWLLLQNGQSETGGSRDIIEVHIDKTTRLVPGRVPIFTYQLNTYINKYHV